MNIQQTFDKICQAERFLEHIITFFALTKCVITQLICGAMVMTKTSQQHKLNLFVTLKPKTSDIDNESYS